MKSNLSAELAAGGAADECQHAQAGEYADDGRAVA